mmetsp:Transcript_28363/g.42958  ORF Transcript_28363/g.42958 Transcript_28363/m.42958 type:complete len:99 (+) Transcript_28363:423-719(+)|eukprot:CAMPEP_0170482094 /NCGR_PEP_ID=MMETSP0208-20121228/2265_1 /TAXON_ID=197538 /ORGANISM="Strombidium inclinatum, Strain S3" /LENGTH=98 /DNA_ID=CAMNT_0010754891 /DNA_START=3222 /DNA_END=3518 /DNA_ORIENTATION=+
MNSFGLLERNIVKALNGLEAFELATDATDMFDLILMDLDMPIMDGFEAAYKIKKTFSQTRTFGGELGEFKKKDEPPSNRRWSPYIVAVSSAMVNESLQ